MATDAAQKAGAHAGNLIKGAAAIVGGGGGGRPNMAQAGGKNPEKVQEAIDEDAGILEAAAGLSFCGKSRQKYCKIFCKNIQKLLTKFKNLI